MTWQPAQPYACRAYGFRSQTMPAAVVLRESGKPCGLREERPAPSQPGSSGKS
ncbi:MAG: hypothetical protein R3D59_19245 [Paracoccaceae bacterium]